MQVIDIMTSPARTARPSTSVVAALRMLADHRLSSLPVVNDDGAVVGIVSERDLLNRAIDAPSAAHRWGGARRGDLPAEVREVMTPDPHTVRPDADVAHVAHVFSMMSWKAIPVVRDGRLVGVISRSDIVRALSRDDGAMCTDLERLCSTAGHAGWRVRVSGGVAEVAGPRDAQERAEATRLARSVVGVRRVDVVPVDADPSREAPAH
jgi:CBS domain-containing protein